MTKYFGDKKFYQRILRISIPIIIQSGITNFVNLLDNIMIGRLGTLSMSGVSIANQLLSVFNTTCFGAMSGPGIFMAQFYVNQDKKGVKDCYHFKIYSGALLFIIAIILFICLGDNLIGLFLTGDNNPDDVITTLNYGHQYLRIMLFGLLPFVITQAYSSSLRETGNTVLPMFSSLIAVSTNFVLNYLLIFGNFGFPELGIAGAAWATVISRYVEATFIVCGTHFINKNEYLSNLFSQFAIPAKLVQQMIIKSIPMLSNEILWSTTLTAISQCYSTRGLITVAAININDTIYHFFLIICTAMGSSTAIIVGQQLGSGNEQEAVDTDRKMVVLNTILGFLFGVLMFISAQFIPLVYNVESEVRSLSTSLMEITAALLLVSSIYYTSYFTLRAGGKTFLTMLFDSGYSCIITLPVAFVLTYFTDLKILTIFLIVKLMDVPKAILGLYLLHKGIWVHNLAIEKRSN